VDLRAGLDTEVRGKSLACAGQKLCHYGVEFVRKLQNRYQVISNGVDEGGL